MTLASLGDIDPASPPRLAHMIDRLLLNPRPECTLSSLRAAMEAEELVAIPITELATLQAAKADLDELARLHHDEQIILDRISKDPPTP